VIGSAGRERQRKIANNAGRRQLRGDPDRSPWTAAGEYGSRGGRAARRRPFVKDVIYMELEYELQTHRAEDRHWWYQGRRTVLERAIERLGLPAHAQILDAGCGSGRNMVELARLGTVTGVELSGTSVQLARERDAGEVVEGSVMDMPFDDANFDLTVSLDVIEHLEDDIGALRELRRATKPGGALLVTVPAYQWLWSGHDEINHHHRRYNRRTLLSAAQSGGWELESFTNFSSLTLPVAILLRALERFMPSTTKSSLDLWVPPAPLNWALRQPLNLEASVIGRGGSIPAGLSLLAVFR
jgi:SAM-dependent methyltransferase